MFNEILHDIVELGFISIQDSRITTEIKPIFNLYTENRWDPTIQYLKDYVKYNADFEGDYFLCIYDGWREYSDPVGANERIYVSWLSLSEKEQNGYINKGSKGEPRFSHKAALNPFLYPELPHKVIAYNRHKDDRNALLIPDYEFLIHQFSQFIVYSLRNDIPLYKKLPKIFWRGTEHNMMTEYTYSSDGTASAIFPNISKIDQRHLLTALSSSILFDIDVRDILDASFQRTPMSEFFLFKYVIDVDGYVSAWSGLFWKLYSNSVVLKAPSYWYRISTVGNHTVV